MEGWRESGWRFLGLTGVHLSGVSGLPSDHSALLPFLLAHLSAPFCLFLPLLFLCQSLYLNLLVYENSEEKKFHLNREVALAFPNGVHFDPPVSDSQCLFGPFLCSLLLPLYRLPLLFHSAWRAEFYAPVGGSSGFPGLCPPDRDQTGFGQATAEENEGCAGAQR